MKGLPYSVKGLKSSELNIDFIVILVTASMTASCLLNVSSGMQAEWRRGVCGRWERRQRREGVSKGRRLWEDKIRIRGGRHTGVPRRKTYEEGEYKRRKKKKRIDWGGGYKQFGFFYLMMNYFLFSCSWPTPTVSFILWSSLKLTPLVNTHTLLFLSSEETLRCSELITDSVRKRKI